VRSCSKFPDPASLQQCKESFRLFYSQSDADSASTFNESAFTYLDVIAANYVFNDNTDVTVNIETRSLAVGKRGIYFAFNDQGSCMTLMSILVYYVMCPSVISNYALFPNTSAASDLTSVVQVDGVCVPRASIEAPPKYLCKSDGSWYLLSGGCKCAPGYEPDQEIAQQCSGRNIYVG